MRTRSKPLICVLVCCLTSTAVALDSDGTGAAGTPSEQTAPLVRFASPATMAETGRTRAVWFAVNQEPTEDLTLDTVARGAIEVVRPAQVVGGHTFGFARIRGLRVGDGVLRIGDQELVFRVVAPRTDRDREVEQPTLYGLANRAVLYDTVVLGAEARIDPSLPDDGTLTVRLSGPPIVGIGQQQHLLTPTDSSDGEAGSHMQATFALDAAALQPGQLTLTPVRTTAAGRVIEGRAITVTIPSVPPLERIEVEAETKHEVERLRRYGLNQPHAGESENASGGKYIVNAAPTPAAQIPLKVEEPGTYQIFASVAGTPAQGIFPTIGIRINEENYPRGTSRLVTHKLQRLAIGTPISLPPGEHLLIPLFENDHYVRGLEDRNLMIDKLEIVRLVGGADGAANSMGAMGGAMMGGDASVLDDPLGEQMPPLRVSFAGSMEDRLVGGAFDLHAKVTGSFGDLKQLGQAPEVRLLINDYATPWRATTNPIFRLDPSRLEAGTNHLQMEARWNGLQARSPVQTVRYAYEDGPHRGQRIALDEHYFAPHAAGWDQEYRKRLRDEHRPPEGVSAKLFSNGTVRLTLPPQLTGTFRLDVRMRSENHDGPAQCTMAVHHDGERETTNFEPVSATDGWRWQSPGNLELHGGQQSLTLAFSNDHYVKDKGDRNLLIETVRLRTVPPADEHMPVFNVLHPTPGERLYEADVLLLEVADDREVKWVSVRIDDLDMGLTAVPLYGNGLVAVALPLRELEEGSHKLRIQISDGTNTTQHRELPFEVAPGHGPTRFAQATQLLNRLGYGPDMRSLRRLLQRGPRGYLADTLGLNRSVTLQSGDLAALGAATNLFTNIRSGYHVGRRAVAHTLLSPNPIRTRLTLFMDNHLSTWLYKSQPDQRWQGYADLLQYGPVTLRDALFASAESGAMLRYLDQARSVTGAINENYAREIMELHTLGVHGGYSQEDVTGLAHLLTGWTAALLDNARSNVTPYTIDFRFDPKLSDGAERVVLGVRHPGTESGRERYDRIRYAIECLLAHPSTANFLAQKMVHHYVGAVESSERNAQIANDLAGVFARTDGDLREMLIALAEDARVAASPTRLSHPQRYAFRLMRVTGTANPWAIGDYLSRSQAGMFERATPDGYPEEDEAWADSNAMVQRWSLTNVVEYQALNTAPYRLRHELLFKTPADTQRLIDTLAIRMTGGLLSERSNAAALQYLQSITPAEGEPSDPHQRARALASFLGKLPEMNLN